VPGQLRRSVDNLRRLDPALLAPAEALRVALGVVLPLVIAVSVGHPAEGVAAAAGALSVGFASFQGVYRTRARAMVLTACGMAVSTLVGGAVGGQPVVLVLVTALWALGAGLLTALGPPGTVIGLQCTVALIIVVLIQIAAVATILGRPWGSVAVGGLVCLSRVSLLISCASGIPAARPDGLGAAVAGVVPRVASGIGVAVAAGVGCVLLAITGSPWWLGVVAVVLSFLVGLLLVLRCSRRFGGITGDVLGAGIELTLAALLIVGSAG